MQQKNNEPGVERDLKIDFLRFKWVAASISLMMLLSFAAFSYYRWQTRGYIFSYSIDFVGGTQVLLRFDKPIQSEQLQHVLDQRGWKGAVIRDLSERELLVRVKEFSHDARGIGSRVQDDIKELLPDYSAQVLQSDAVGPGIGAASRWKSIRMIIFALIAMLLYIACRFWSFAFALGAVVALFHDAVAMLAVFLFLDREISINVISAIVAVLGYSINDTIVIFSQIREYFKKMEGSSLTTIVNTSLNHTFRRTLLTSVSTGIPVGVMFLYGGEALKDFSLALLVGIIFGTYSSIYVANPVMMLFYNENRNK